VRIKKVEPGVFSNSLEFDGIKPYWGALPDTGLTVGDKSIWFFIKPGQKYRKKNEKTIL